MSGDDGRPTMTPSRTPFLVVSAKLRSTRSSRLPMVNERATEMRCWEILQAEEDAGTVSDALDAANRVMALFVMGDDGWDLRVKTAKMVTPPQQVVMLATAQVGPTAQRPTPKGPTVHPGGTAVKDVFQDVGLMGQQEMVQGANGTLGIDLGGRI